MQWDLVDGFRFWPAPEALAASFVDGAEAVALAGHVARAIISAPSSSLVGRLAVSMSLLANANTIRCHFPP